MIIKKFLALILAISMMMSAFSFAYAEPMTTILSANTTLNTTIPEQITVLLNDTIIDFEDENGNVVNPEIINDRTMVPVRKIFETFGATVDYDSTTKIITATKENKSWVLQIGNPEAIFRDGEVEEKMILDSVPVILNNRTLVPVRYIAESLDLHVGWEGDTRTVVILDSSFIYEKLSTQAPTFYEFLTREYEAINSYTGKTEATMNVKYTDSEERENNTNVKYTVDGTEELSENKAHVNYIVKATGKGALYEKLKDTEMTNISLEGKVDATLGKAFIKSNLLEAKIGDKWYEMSLLDNEESTLKTRNTSFVDSVEYLLDNIDITSTTYYELNELMNVVCELVSDEHFSVAGRNTKTYKYQIELEDVLNVIGIEIDDFEKSLDLNKFDISLEYLIKTQDNMIKETNVEIDAEIATKSEKIAIDLELENTIDKINKTVEINMPTQDEVGYIEEQ